jgi:hypothetical protein
MSGSLLGVRKIQKCHILTEGKLGNTGIQLEANRKKSVCLFAVQSGVSEVTANMAIKFLKLQPYKVNSSARTLFYRLGSKKPVLQVVSRISIH